MTCLCGANAHVPHNFFWQCQCGAGINRNSDGHVTIRVPMGQVIRYMQDEPPVPLPEPVFAIEPIVAWRGFRIVRRIVQGMRFEEEGTVYQTCLSSLNRNRIFWEPGENTATCEGGSGFYNLGEHKSPSPHCTCGYYAKKAVDIEIMDYGPEVIGTVELYGTVIEGSRGYRAEKARIKELFLEDEDWANDLREYYGVPVTVVGAGKPPFLKRRKHPLPTYITNTTNVSSGTSAPSTWLFQYPSSSGTAGGESPLPQPELHWLRVLYGFSNVTQPTSSFRWTTT